MKVSQKIYSVMNTVKSCPDQSLIRDVVKQWLGFDKILSRDRFHTGAEGVRSDDACEWLLQDETFRKWYRDRGSVQLVLTGEMGCGKTVLTTFVTKRMLLRGDHQIPRSLVCYHYCRDDESGNAVYIAQSLVLQLIHQHAKPLEKQFHDWYKETCSENKPVPTLDLNALLGYFCDRVSEIAENREVVVILDGLDECDTKIVSFVDRFRQLSDAVPHFKVLYSTRPHTRILNLLSHVPHLSINSKLNRSRDETLARHLVKKLEPKLGDEEEGKELMGLLVTHLAQSAQGSAIWIRVMVDLVDDQDIVDISDMRDFLRDTPQPQELNDVYVKLFQHRVKGNAKVSTIPTTNHSRSQADQFPIKLIATASRALEILAVSRRPLSLNELSYAVAMNECDETTTCLGDVKDKLSPNRLKQLIEPFVAQYKPDEPALPQIKLLHRSLQEFILRHSPLDWTNVYLQTSLLEHEPIDAMQRRRGTLERQMFQACATYLLLDEINDHSLLSQDEVGFNAISSISDCLFSDDKSADETAKSLGEKPDRDATFDPVALGMGPFFVYAACYWLEYLGKLVEPSPEMVEQIIRLMDPGSARLRNWGDQYCRPECSLAPKFDFSAEELDPLSLVTLYGSDDIFRAMLTQSERFAGPEFQPTKTVVHKGMLGDHDHEPTTVFRTAMMKLGQGDDLARLRLLFLDDRTGPQMRIFGFFRGVLKAWRRFATTTTSDCRWSDAFDLVRYASGEMVRDEWANWLLCESARSGCIGMMRRLFDEAARNNALRSQLLADAKRDEEYNNTAHHWQIHQSVGEAVLSRSVEAVRFLLDQPGIGPHFRHRNRLGYTVFFMAARDCNPAMLELLLSRLPSLCDNDDDEAARLINQVNDDGDSALNQIIFSSRGTVRLRCVELLLASGADPNLPRDLIDSRPLAQAAVRGDLDLIRLLVRCGGDAVDPGCLLVSAGGGGDGSDQGRIGKLTLRFPMLEQEERLHEVVKLLTELLAARQEGFPDT